MSIRHGLLALLERGPMYGYQLRAAFEESTGSTWPLNIGQVYTTLSRLERDGLVRPLPENDGGQRPYEITDAGRAELALWFATPISRTDRPRDELAIKLALALTTPGVDVRAVVQTQRSATMRALQEFTRLKYASDRPGGPGLAAGAGLDGLPGRGGGPLAGPLRDQPGPAPPSARPVPRRGDRRRRRSDQADEPVRRRRTDGEPR